MSFSSAERSDRIDELFDAAVDLPPGEQTAFIERACGDDVEMCAELLELVRAYRSEGVLDAPSACIATSVIQAATALGGPVPELIGPFRIVREIGRGGMGRVVLGERVDGQFEQRVAIKLIQQAAPGILKRFIEERKLLARLSHPGIARLLDGGVAQNGAPYFVMELVDGLPIDEYCESRDLSLDRRLELVASVCEAVAYAHQHLIIHRDLKPSNILVSESGQVKLLDFGIAKVIDPTESDDDSLPTDVQAMTPEFAAPEQVLRRPVTTATDVYSLGVLLYALVTGERPYDVRGKTPGELERIVCEEMPPKPSTKAPAPLRRRIQGDLDLIVMTALQKDERRRYQSPTALAQDLQRFRDGLAIAARADSAPYRVRKFIGRHRVGVALAALTLLGLGGAASRERVLRSRAEVEARKALEVKRFLIGVFDNADPDGLADANGGGRTTRELLDRGAARVDSTLSEQPEVQAELRSVLGRVYTNLGIYGKASALLQQSLEQRVSLRGESDSTVAETMDRLGTALTRQDRLAEAEPLLRQALAQRRTLFGSADTATATTMDHLATVLKQQRKFDEAETLYREALEIRRRLLGDSAVDLANSLNNLGLLFSSTTRHAEAESLLKAALGIKTAKLGEDHVLTARARANLALIYQRRGNYEQAEVHHRQALAAKRRALGDSHPSVAISLNSLASLLAYDLGRLEEAETLVREALAVNRKAFGEPHTYVAADLMSLGLILRMNGKFAEADAALGQSADMHRRLFGDRDIRLPYALLHLGLVRAFWGNGGDAISPMRQSLSLYRAVVGDGDQNTVGAASQLAWVLAEQGSATEAESLARATLARVDENKPEYGAVLAIARVALGKSLLAQARVNEALPVLEASVERVQRKLGKQHWRVGDAYLAYGKALLAKGRVADARAALTSARTVLESHRRAHPRLAAQAFEAVERLGR